MISIASCGCLVVTSACSAVAVVFRLAPRAAQLHRVRPCRPAARLRREAATLGLDDLEVFGPDVDPTVVPNVGCGPQHGVANGADDVERLLVAEAAISAARARDLAGGASVANVVAPSAPRVELGEDASQGGRSRAGASPRGVSCRLLARPLQVASWSCSSRSMRRSAAS